MYGSKGVVELMQACEESLLVRAYTEALYGGNPCTTECNINALLLLESSFRFPKERLQ